MIADKIYNSDKKPKYSKEVFKRLLGLATSGIFILNNKFFRQTDGVTMGFPLFANFCIACFEEKLMTDTSASSCTPALYVRYVDDILCTFRFGSSHEEFLSKLNNLHPNLKFTSEIGPSIPVLIQPFLFLPQIDR